MNPILTIGLSIVAALLGGGGVAGLLMLRPNRKKINAEAQKVDVDANEVLRKGALEMYEKAMAAAERAEKKADQADRKVQALERHVSRLEGMMRAEGMTPPRFQWPPANEGATS